MSRMIRSSTNYNYSCAYKHLRFFSALHICFFATWIHFASPLSVHVPVKGPSPISISTPSESVTPDAPAATLSLSGNWAEAKKCLQRTDCCVVTITGSDTHRDSDADFTSHLQVLQDAIADKGPMDIDLRKRIRTSSSKHLHNDCITLCQSILGDEKNDNDDDDAFSLVTSALKEIALGAASMADGKLETDNTGNVDVFIRIVCAGDYAAIDPMFHTDKCPIRGYVTLRGVGTEYRTKPCSILEYILLRSLGIDIGDNSNNDLMKCADELEFIVMKGDHYNQSMSKESKSTKSNHNWWTWTWKRAFTCVHRSPPGKGGRRVILSFDLAAGEDDREWYQVGQKREWRSGMTQRKSRLVV